MPRTTSVYSTANSRRGNSDGVARRPAMAISRPATRMHGALQGKILRSSTNGRAVAGRVPNSVQLKKLSGRAPTPTAAAPTTRAARRRRSCWRGRWRARAPLAPLVALPASACRLSVQVPSSTGIWEPASLAATRRRGRGACPSASSASMAVLTHSTSGLSLSNSRPNWSAGWPSTGGNWPTSCEPSISTAEM